MSLKKMLRDMSIVLWSRSGEHPLPQFLKTYDTVEKICDRFNTFKTKMKFVVIVIDEDSLVRMAVKFDRTAR